MPDLMAERTAADTTFGSLLQQHQGRVQALLRRLSPRDADDLLQETMARAWRYRSSCDQTANPAAWLLQVAFRSFLDHRARVRRQHDADAAAVRADRVEPNDAPAQRDELQRALHRLSPLQRAILLGFHQEQLSLQQLAARHGLPTNTVKSHLHRARQLLVPPTTEDRE